MSVTLSRDPLTKQVRGLAWIFQSANRRARNPKEKIADKKRDNSLEMKKVHRERNKNRIRKNVCVVEPQFRTFFVESLCTEMYSRARSQYPTAAS